MILTNLTRGTVLTTNAQNAKSLTRGLLDGPPEGSSPDDWGLILRPCAGIHMNGMWGPIDAIFLRGYPGSRILACFYSIQPNSPNNFSPWGVSPNGVWCVELPAGTLLRNGTVVGDAVELTAK